MLILAGLAAAASGFRENAWLAVLVLAALAAGFLITWSLVRHGVAGALCLAAARLIVWATAYKAAKRALAEAWPEQRRNAIEEAAR